MKHLKKIAAFLTAATLAVGCSASTDNTNTTTTDDASGSNVRIGIIQLVEHSALDASCEGFEDYLKDNGYADAEISFNNAQGETANCTAIVDKYVNDKVDLIYAIATPAAQAAASATKDIPIVVCAVTDPASADLVKSNDKPETNVTGASDLNPVDAQFELLKEILPDAKTVGLMYCSAEANSVVQIDLAKAECEKLGLDYVEAPVSESNQIQQMVESLNGKVDVIYIPTDNMLAESMATVSQTANQFGIPTIVGEENMVSNGGLATYGLNYYELGKLAGAQAVAILKDGKNPADMAIEYLPADGCTLTVNSKTAETLGINLPQSVLDRAVVVGEEE